MTTGPTTSVAPAGGRWGSEGRVLLAAVTARRGTMASALILLIVIVACTAAPLIAPFGPQTEDLSHTLALPSLHHLLGTDELGQDVLSRLLYGGDSALLGVVEATATAVLLAVPAGLAAGFYGGWINQVVGRTIDVTLALPGIIILLMVLAIFAHNLTASMVTVGILFAPGMARVTAGVTAAVRHDLYVEAGIASGFSSALIVWRHVLPRVIGPILVQVTIAGAGALIVQTGVDLLGFGAGPSVPSWGGMLADGENLMAQQWWLVVPPGAVVGVVTICLVVLGNGVREALTAPATGWRQENARRSARVPQRAGRKATSRPRPVTLVEESDPGDEVQFVENALLRVANLAVARPDGDREVPVVQRVSFAVERGKILAVVGESGSGKTVTALAVLGLLPRNLSVTGGQVTFDGRDLLALSTRERRKIRGSDIAYVSQEPMASHDGSRRVGSSLLEVIHLHNRGLSGQARRSRGLELLGMVGIRDAERVYRSYPHELSGGQAQRVSIALSLAGNPRLLIADEPTTALDANVQVEILALLRHLTESENLAVVLITHDWGVVTAVADRAVVMYSGQNVEEGATAALTARPVHPYTAALLESDPRLWDGSEDLKALPGSVPMPGAWPDGCRFASRCEYRTTDCTERKPGSVVLPDGRSVRCFNWRDVQAAKREGARG
jgi:peptide/nickel transport system permease protein